MNIQNIGKTYEGLTSIDDVTVVWCSLISELNHASIIGWYRHTKIFRDVRTLPLEEFVGRGLKDVGYVHNVEANKEDCGIHSNQLKEDQDFGSDDAQRIPKPVYG